jgi:hypothetical protein
MRRLALISVLKAIKKEKELKQPGCAQRAIYNPEFGLNNPLPISM